MSNHRNVDIDTAKGVLMTLVIVGHVLLASSDLSFIESTILKVIYAFHMPAFLIISGILFDCDKQRNRNFIDNLKSKIKRILFPYLIFELLGCLVHNIFVYGERESFPTIIKNIITFQIYVGADWYLLTCFIALLMVFLVNKITTSKIAMPATGVIFYIIVCICQFVGTHSVSVYIIRILLAYSFIVLGISMKHLFCHFDRKHVCIAFVCFACSVTFNSTVFMHAGMIGNPILFFIGGMCGSYLIICFSYNIKSKLMNIIGRYSIVPMGIHQNLIWIFGWFFGLSGKMAIIIPNLFFTYCISVCITIMYSKIRK